MSVATQRHCLRAIVMADVVGYSRLMGMDDEGTLASLEAARAVFHQHATAQQGRIAGTAGDAVLAVFDTATGAVNASLAVQAQLAAMAAAQPEDRRMRFRIGIHLGDVIEREDGDVYGDGVNIAARLESLADPGGILVSQSVQSAVLNRVKASFEDIGEQSVKNIAQPVRAFRITDAVASRAAAGPTASISGSASAKPAGRRRRFAWLAVAAAGIVGLAGVLLWQPWHRMALTIPVAVGPGTGTAGAAASAAPVREQSIAVVPFANLSDDRNNEYFADGISEELVNILSRLPGLKVVARTSALQFKGKQVPPPEIARQLGVTYLVDGTVRKSGERVRIGVQLIDARDGVTLWSETFDRELRDLFAVQVEVAVQIAASLKVRIDAAGLAGSGTTNPEAYRLYIDGRRARGDAREEMFNRALALDPKFAPVHVALASLWLRQAIDDEAFLDQARAAAATARIVDQLNEALTLDPRSSAAHVLLGYLAAWNGRTGEFRGHLAKALELNPSDPDAHDGLAEAYLFEGNLDEALAERKRNVDLDPLNGFRFQLYAQFLLWAGRPEAALEAIDRAIAIKPDRPETQELKARTLAMLGRRDEALALARSLVKRQGGWQAIDALRLAGGRRDLEMLSRSADLDPSTRAAVALSLGHHSEFLDWFVTRSWLLPSAGFLMFDPVLDPVRQDPRFKATLDRMGLTQADARAQAWRARHPGATNAKP